MTQTTAPAEILEKRAAEQRRAIHDDVQQLRSVVKAEVHERLDLKRNVRRYFAPIAGAAALVALSLGYGLTGIFTRDSECETRRAPGALTLRTDRRVKSAKGSTRTSWDVAQRRS